MPQHKKNHPNNCLHSKQAPQLHSATKACAVSWVGSNRSPHFSKKNQRPCLYFSIIVMSTAKPSPPATTAKPRSFKYSTNSTFRWMICPPWKVSKAFLGNPVQQSGWRGAVHFVKKVLQRTGHILGGCSGRVAKGTHLRCLLERGTGRAPAPVAIRILAGHHTYY